MSTIAPLDSERVAAIVQAALDEDGAQHDLTSSFLDLGDRVAVAEINPSAPITVCGVDVTREVFHRVDARLAFDAPARDGDRLAAGAVICRLEGRAASIVAAERTALNFLQRMSGVATLASHYVTAVEGTGVVILDTRKTIPLWRELDKYAVRCGGAQNHRRALDAMVLVKDNHVRALGGPGALIARLGAVASQDQFVEVEVDSIEFMQALAGAKVDRIMLDNFTPAQVAAALEQLRAHRAANAGNRLEVEVSGGITLDNVRDYALPGVDFISVGDITHSAPAAPMSLSIL
jgi:nicotinate-nucleotide pyrophosphorylase (carboxylating)